MSLIHFSATELTELEALEIMGGASTLLVTQKECVNEAEGCALGTTQTCCTNKASHCACVPKPYVGNGCHPNLVVGCGS